MASDDKKVTKQSNTTTDMYGKLDPNGNYYDPSLSYLTYYWTYYFNYLSVMTHMFVMYYAMSFWCGSSKIAILYTF
jgi:hypothetical protein